MAHGDFVSGEILTAANLNTHLDEKLDLAGGTMTGALTLGGIVQAANNSIEGVGNLEWEPVTLLDDESAFFSFSADARGMVLIAPNVSGGGGYIGCFRVNTGAYNSELASFGSVAAPTPGGAMTGTTGTDGNFTIRPHNSLDRLYVENRTGGTRTYHVAFLCMDGNASGGPTIV